MDLTYVFDFTENPEEVEPGNFFEVIHGPWPRRQETDEQGRVLRDILKTRWSPAKNHVQAKRFAKQQRANVISALAWGGYFERSLGGRVGRPNAVSITLFLNNKGQSIFA